MIAGGAPLEDRAQVWAGAASGGASGSGTTAGLVTRPVHCWNITGSTSRVSSAGRDRAPTMTTAIGRCVSAPIALDNAAGTSPSAASAAVISTGAQPVAGALDDRLVAAARPALRRSSIAESDQHAVERRLTDERDEADRRRDRHRHVDDPQPERRRRPARTAR